jgi:hypothetical protein
MRALVKAEPSEGLVMRDEPVPKIGPDDILIKVAKTGICGTDLHIWKWDQWAQKTIPVPMVVGHEFAGTVAEIGSHVRTVKVGDRVSGEGHLIGRKSRMARAGHFHLDPETKGIGVNVPGAFADYVKIPAFNAIHFTGDTVGNILMYGLGAGSIPTGSAVAADVVDIARNIRCGSIGRVPPLSYQPDQMQKRRITPMDELYGPYYLRCTVLDQPGVLSTLSGILSNPETIPLFQAFMRIALCP